MAGLHGQEPPGRGGEGLLVTVDDESTCTAFGPVVAEDRIDRGPGWRLFEADSRNRVGAPLTATRHDRGGCRRRSGS